MSGVGFTRPELLWLLLLLPPLVALVVVSVRARRRARVAFGGPKPLAAHEDMRRWLRSALLLVAFGSVVIALAGPFVDLRVRAARRLGVDIVLAIDVSQSMATKDVEPDRLRAARHVAQAIGERTTGSRVSLVLFAGQGALRYPATTDPRVLGEVLDNSGKGVKVLQGTNLAAAIDSAAAALPTDGGPQRARSIVLVSDGEGTLGKSPQLDALVAAGVRVFTIGVGTPQGGPVPTYDANDGHFTGYLRGPDGAQITSRLDEQSLRDLATGGAGQYWRFGGDDRVIDELTARLRSLEAVEPVEAGGSVPDERSSIFLGVAVAAVLLERLIDERRRMPAPVRSGAGRARRPRRILGLVIGSAMLWSVACGSDVPSLQSANARFAAGDYLAALAMYRDLQGAGHDVAEVAIDAANTLHMLGDHERALADYSHAIDIASVDTRWIAQYDRGNTLFRLGRLEDARDAYREALRLEPGDRDAKFNLELVQRLLDQRLTTKGKSDTSGPPGSTGATGGSGGSSRPTGSSGPSQPGPGTPSDDQTPPSSDRAPGEGPPGDLRQALKDFRQGYTLDEALAVLNALSGQQRGITQLIEGPRPPSQGSPQY